MKKSTKSMIFDVICFIGGGIILVVSAMNFDTGGGGTRLTPGPYYYFYPLSAQVGMVVGVVMIVWGFLRKSWRKEGDNRKEGL